MHRGKPDGLEHFEHDDDCGDFYHNITTYYKHTREDSCKSSKGLKRNMNYPVDKFSPLNICNQAEGTMNTESVANESTIT